MGKGSVEGRGRADDVKGVDGVKFISTLLQCTVLTLVEGDVAVEVRGGRRCLQTEPALVVRPCQQEQRRVSVVYEPHVT